MKARVLVLLVFLSGCSFGVGPTYRKIDDNGTFLLTQNLNKDILCVKDKKIKRGMRCFYVSGNINSRGK